MGKASSSKKVARAARAGGGRVASGQPRSLLFPGVLVLVVVLGLALVVFARNDRLDEERGGVPQISDHIHEALAVNVCGEWLEDLPEFESTIGIHSHGDGVVHIHPFSELGVGANAVLERYLADARDAGLDFSLSNSKLTYLDETYKEGTTPCEGVEDPQLRLARWEDVADAASDPEITSGDFGDLRLDTDGAGIVIYYGDPDGDIPRPPKADQLAELGAQDAAPTPDDSASTTTSTTAGEPSETTSTTAAAETTTTAAP